LIRKQYGVFKINKLFLKYYGLNIEQGLTFCTIKSSNSTYEASFHVNEIRFNNGVSNIVEYITSKNNLDTAKLNLLNARFEYILRVRVLDYYRGI